MTWWQSLLIALIPALITAVISGLFSYFSAIKKAEKSIDELSEKHRQEIEKLQVQHKLEMEKIQQQQEYEQKVKEQEVSKNVGTELLTTLLKLIAGSGAMKQKVEELVEKSVKTQGSDKDAD